MKLLLVYGDGDGGARYFQENYDTNEVYKEMVSAGVTKTDKSDGWDDNGLHIEIHEFNNVDPKFMDFLYSENLIDIDRAEDQDFFVIEEGV